MKAYIITLDALVAVAFIFLAMAMLYSYTFQPSVPKDIYLKQISFDTITVMEKTGRLGQIIEGNSTGARSLLERTPKSICIQMMITDSSENDVFTILKENCGSYGNDFQVTYRTFVQSNQIYTVKTYSWYKKESI